MISINGQNSKEEEKVLRSEQAASDCANLREQLLEKVNHTADFCQFEGRDLDFYQFEQILVSMISIIGQLFIQLFLHSRHYDLSLKPWLEDGTYRQKDFFFAA